MKILFFLCIFLGSLVAGAESIQDRIHAIENGMIKFENGRIAFLDKDISDLHPKEYIKAEVDERSTLKSFVKMTPPGFYQEKNISLNTPPMFEPSVVPDIDEARKIFNRSNPNYRRISECTDRAHVWAHDEFKFSGTKSRKLFVFFTASYINSNRFKWWFHVAPLYTVNDRGALKDLVMDFRYTDRPMTVKEFTDQFVYTKRECKVTTKFSDYDNNPQSEDCYVIVESMHYKTPDQIAAQETDNKFKTVTSEAEVKASFRYAFHPN